MFAIGFTTEATRSFVGLHLHCGSLENITRNKNLHRFICFIVIFTKTEGMWIGSSRKNKAKPFGIKWPNEPIKALGVHYTYDLRYQPPLKLPFFYI